MSTRHPFAALALTLALALAAMAAACARDEGPSRAEATAAKVSAPVTTTTTERTIIVHRSEPGVVRYYRTDEGKLYAVYDTGQVRLVDQPVRIERSPLATYYIVGDTGPQYYVDEGGRLFYRQDGRPVYLPEGGATMVVDPLPVMSGTTVTRIENVPAYESCNASWRRCTASCYASDTLLTRRSCFDNCDVSRDQCLR